MLKQVSCHVKPNGVLTFYDDGSSRFVKFPLENHQLHPKKFPLPGRREPEYEKDKYTFQQNKHYRLAIYGLGSIPQEELKTYGRKEFRNARRTFTRAQAELNRMKNQRLDQIFNEEMIKVFGKSKLGQVLTQSCENEYDLENRLDLSFLKITKDMVVERLTSRGILERSVFGI